MILKTVLALSLSITASIANAGYGEINSVGDIRQLKNVSNLQSSVTDSVTWLSISKDAPHFVVEDKNAEAKNDAKLKFEHDLLKAQKKSIAKAEAKKLSELSKKAEAEEKRIKVAAAELEKSNSKEKAKQSSFAKKEAKRIKKEVEGLKSSEANKVNKTSTSLLKHLDAPLDIDIHKCDQISVNAVK